MAKRLSRGVRRTEWPGRLEWIRCASESHAPLLLDVAHNPAAAWALRAALAQLPEEMPRTLIFSCLADKPIAELAQILLPLFDASLRRYDASPRPRRAGADPEQRARRPLNSCWKRRKVECAGAHCCQSDGCPAAG